MDDLLREFVTETNESLDVVDVELVRFEQDPNNAQILDNIFRLVHTIKGTCGFLGLPRLEALAHAAETLMGKFRDGAPASSEAVVGRGREQFLDSAPFRDARISPTGSRWGVEHAKGQFCRASARGRPRRRCGNRTSAAALLLQSPLRP